MGQLLQNRLDTNNINGFELSQIRRQTNGIYLDKKKNILKCLMLKLISKCKRMKTAGNYEFLT